MSKARIYARNLAAQWIGHVANMAMMLVSSWFALRLLGGERYGIWALIISLAGYMGIADVGVRPALYRFFNWHLGRNEPQRVNQVLCTSLVFFLIVTIALVLAGFAVGTQFRAIFPETPRAYLQEVRVALTIVAANLGLSMVATAFSSLLSTHERYDLKNAIDIGTGLVRTGCTVAALVLGAGLIGIAIAQVIASLLACVGGYILAGRVFKALRLRPSLVTRDTLRRLLGFGLPCVFSGLGLRIIQHSDSLLIGWFIGLPAVGYYSLARMLLGYSRTLLEKGATIFSPELQQSVARKDFGGVRYLLPRVTRFTTGLGVLLLVGIMVFGHEFLALFYGEAAGRMGAAVLPFLGIANLAFLANHSCRTILSGAGRVKFLAAVVLVQAVANILLSVALVTLGGMGVRGIALGTMIPMVLLSGVVIPIATVRHLRMQLGSYAIQSAGYWIPAAAVFALMSYSITTLPLPVTWGWFAFRVGVATAAYSPIGWFVALTPTHRARLLSAVTGKGGPK